ncbi:hypothetical protein PGT21_029393 [Puccinia graminis f. sp. tritici]|uniref:Uncharacterized protein n=1 Tax=Puccinia graminis f. sp. tritici TaxID=56615 RepID=A0A5B0P0R6_PUCGR|nr:hypothetical protein PGT21_029393 [Puccinia graminis f. sp. tritici]KAA1121544.1 hypothetical protein PGTUg99_031678 [Puccinia graminis f. sp. tritici]
MFLERTSCPKKLLNSDPSRGRPGQQPQLESLLNVQLKNLIFIILSVSIQSDRIAESQWGQAIIHCNIDCNPEGTNPADLNPWPVALSF